MSRGERTRGKLEDERDQVIGRRSPAQDELPAARHHLSGLRDEALLPIELILIAECADGDEVSVRRCDEAAVGLQTLHDMSLTVQDGYELSVAAVDREGHELLPLVRDHLGR